MNKQNKHYQQLTQEPRYQISGLRKAGMSLRAIAAEVGVHSSTVSRELRRNGSEGGYDLGIAHQSYYVPSSHTTLQEEATSILTQGGAVIVM